jgi:hypothetical protein
MDLPDPNSAMRLLLHHYVTAHQCEKGSDESIAALGEAGEEMARIYKSVVDLCNHLLNDDLGISTEAYLQLHKVCETLGLIDIRISMSDKVNGQDGRFYLPTGDMVE